MPRRTFCILSRMNLKFHLLHPSKYLNRVKQHPKIIKIMPFLSCSRKFSPTDYYILSYPLHSKKQHCKGPSNYRPTSPPCNDESAFSSPDIEETRQSPQCCLKYLEIKLLFDDYDAVQFRFTKTVVHIALPLHETFRGNFILFD